jgi:hypothetical protein
MDRVAAGQPDRTERPPGRRDQHAMVMIGEVGDGVGLVIAQRRGGHELLRHAIRAPVVDLQRTAGLPRDVRHQTCQPAWKEATVEPVGRVRKVLQRNRRPGRPVVSDEPVGQDRIPAVGGVRR